MEPDASRRCRLSHPAMGSYPRRHRRRTASDGIGSAHLEVDVPLSEHEQRLLEQIERALVDDDPKFASSVRTGDRRLKARRKLQLGIVLVVVGLAVMVVGGAVAQNIPVGVLGSLV